MIHSTRVDSDLWVGNFFLVVQELWPLIIFIGLILIDNRGCVFSLNW
jgi:hypothetical protein